MATAQAPRPRAKYDALLEAHIEHARSRVRNSDLLTGSLGLICLLLGFGVAMVLADRWFVLPDWSRQLALAGFLATAGGYAYRVFARPLLQRVNPYYAARQVEQTIPEAKNSIITWLDLRDETLAPTVRDAVTRKAAEDLGYANVEQAVSDRRMSLFGVAAAALAAAALALMLLLRPAPFFSLLSRAFLPFGSTAIARQTELTILEPAGGNATVPIHQSVLFRVDVGGRVPRVEDADAIRLRLRYNPDDAVWEEKRFEATDKARLWSLRLPSAQVRTGFEYQVVGGDAETAVYKVSVRAKPLVTDFEVRYRYRPYLRFQDDVRNDPNLQAVRGTEVTILAKTNRAVAGGVLRLTPHGGQPMPEIAAERVADRSDTLKYTLTLERDGQYRLQFATGDGEKSDETVPYDVRVMPDLPPSLEWTRAAPENLPVNGTLALGAKATDDYGLTKARLRLRFKAAPDSPHKELRHIEHRGGQPLAGADGRHPRALPLSEVVAIEELSEEGGIKPRLQPGAVIEYFFEAEDNFDFPKPQVGQSEIRSVTLGEPQDQPKRDAEREQAKKEQEAQQNQQPGSGNEKPQGGDKPPEQSDAEPSGGDSTGGESDAKETMDKADKLAQAIKQQQQNSQQPDKSDSAQPQDGDKTGQGGETGDRSDNKDPSDKPGGSNSKSGSEKVGDKSGKQPKPDPSDKTDPSSQPGGEAKPGAKPDAAQSKPSEQGRDDNKNGEPGQKSQPQSPDAKKGGNQSEGQPDGAKSKASERGEQADKSDGPKGQTDGKAGDKSAAPGKQPEAKPGDKSQGGDKADAMKDKPDTDQNSGGDKKPTPESAQVERPRNDKPAGPPNPSATRPDGQSNPSNPDGARPNAGQPDAKGSQSPDNKPGEKTDKSGVRPGDGPKDKPNDQAPKTSPDKGNAEGGKQGSQRTDAGPKSTEKAEKPDGQAKGGNSDLNAPKPDGKSDDNAPSNPGQPKGVQPPAKPAAGQPGKPDAAAQKSADIRDADKPHDRPGDASSAKPKSDGTPAQHAPGDKKPADNQSPTKLPADIQKMVDDFQKADDATKKQIMQKLEDMAKSAPTDQRREAAEQGKKICNGDCDNPNGTGGQPKPDGKSDGPGDKPNPGQGANSKADKSGGNRPGNEQAKAQSSQGEPNAGNKPREKADPAAGKRPKADGAKGDAGAANANDPPEGEPKDGDGPASENSAARGQRTGAGDIRGGTAGPPPAPNEEFLRKSGDLQLDDFRKKVDKNVLEQVKMSEDEYREFLKAYESLVKRAKAAKPEAADRVRGAAKGASSANTAARKVDPGEKSGPKTERGGRGAPPPEFREQYKETTEQQSKQKPAGS